tara:strand:+ start:150 stop:302 length:153 start_codon:yes stop_codon:yes gene_type:complete
MTDRKKKIKNVGSGFFRAMHDFNKEEMKKKHKKSVVRKSMIASVLKKKNG